MINDIAELTDYLLDDEKPSEGMQAGFPTAGMKGLGSLTVDLCADGSAPSGITILSNSNSEGWIYFGESGDIVANGSCRLTISADGNMGIASQAPVSKLIIKNTDKN